MITKAELTESMIEKNGRKKCFNKEHWISNCKCYLAISKLNRDMVFYKDLEL